MISSPSFSEILSRAWTTITENTGLSNSSESSVSYAILKAFCQELTNLYTQAEYIETQGQLSSAQGSNLDSIGQFFGVSRRVSTSSSTVGSPYSVKFTNNGATPALISANTRVWPSGDQSIAYFTVSAITVPAGQSVYVDVTAASPGEFHNVGANQLDSNSSGISTITVTNEIPITTGQDIESDDNYRVRIQNEIYRRESSNLIAVREALLEVPGVRDVSLLNLARGTGTLDVLIYGYDRVVPDSVIANCQYVLEQSVAAGISALAKAPVYVQVSVTATLVIKTSADSASVRSLVSSSVRGYCDNIGIEDGSGNGTLIYQELAARVQEASSDIIDSNVSLTVNNLPALKSNQTLLPGEQWQLISVIVQ